MAEEEKLTDDIAEENETPVDELVEAAEEAGEKIHEEAEEATGEEVEQLGDAIFGTDPEDAGVIKPVETDADTAEEVFAEERELVSEHGYGRTTTIMGYTVPFGLYTTIFIVLAILTVVELVAGAIPAAIIRIPALLAFMVAKAVLVVYYYMHLNKDSRIFAIALIVPTAVALIAILFLMAVPVTGY